MHRERENLILFQLIAGQRTWRAVRRPNRQSYNTNYSSRNRNRRTYYRRKSNNNQVGSFVKIDYISRRERGTTIEMINYIFMMIVIIFYYLQIQRGRTYYSSGYQDDYASFRSSLEGLPNFFILRGGTFY